MSSSQSSTSSRVAPVKNELKRAMNHRVKPNSFTIDRIINSLFRPLFHSKTLSTIATILSLVKIVGGTANLQLLRDRQDLSRREKVSSLAADFRAGWSNGANRLAKWYLLIRLFKIVNAIGNRLIIDRQPRRPIRWSEHVVVITGGARGICGHVCKLLRQKGAKVVVLDLPEKSEHGLETLYVQADVTDIKSLLSAKKQVEEKLGYCTMLLLGAGIARHSLILDTEEQFPFELAKQVSDVNYHGVMATLKAFGEHMLPDGGVKDRPYKQAKNGWGGHILIIGSGAAYIELSANAAYNASKAATVSLHSSLSSELHTYHKVDNVRASIICPLKIESKMTEGRMLDTHDQFALPTLTIPEAAEKIVEVLEGDKSRIVYIPRAMYVMSYNKMLPAWVLRALHIGLGATDTFLTYARENRSAEDNIHQK
ncbi:putative oxidoreductase [Pseudozyma hubeiensis]|nr:putative oxidoreductase [Pseudozyma hubeiensis]